MTEDAELMMLLAKLPESDGENDSGLIPYRKKIQAETSRVMRHAAHLAKELPYESDHTRSSEVEAGAAESEPSNGDPERTETGHDGCSGQETGADPQSDG
jgi:hypothetical protein